MSEDVTEAAEQLAQALARLAAEYPTDPEGADAAPLQLGDEERGFDFPDPVALTAGQLTWLAQLVEHELATARNAHSDGNGTCAHCEGTGAARPTGPVTHIVAWFPGDLLSDGPEVSNWEVFTAERWEDGRGIGDWLLGDDAVTKDQEATAEQLQPLVAKMLDPAGPIWLTPGTYTIESVGRDEPGSFFKRGPFTYPMFEVTLVPRQAAAEPGHSGCV
ncbi:hypothetical protein [Streptomyces mobaraensis]|uniref:hypothetical protein n=1 Tax=Streptomyces mobaraensis TaxID=35621 RepID=UPI001F0365DB|nr:hypothetical protein [Streptomyces mobaraensis]